MLGGHLHESILIVAALRDELDHPGVRSTGIGKLNAIYALTKALQLGKSDLVVNDGTAGGLKANLTGLLEVAQGLQVDMLAEPLAPRGHLRMAPHP